MNFNRATEKILKMNRLYFGDNFEILYEIYHNAITFFQYDEC